MNEITKDGKNFVGYEYIEIVTDNERSSLYLDGYMTFGWIPDGNFPPSGILGRTSIKLKRDRKILNKAELTRLQRHFEACMNEIEEMEKSKTRAATIYALIVGLIGTAFLAGSVFAITAATPLIPLCVILGIPGIIGWILPYPIFRSQTQARIKKIAPLIEQKHDEIYEICKKGDSLL